MFCVKVHLNFLTYCIFFIAVVLACHANIRMRHRIGAEWTTYCRGAIPYGIQHGGSTRRREMLLRGRDMNKGLDGDMIRYLY